MNKQAPPLSRAAYSLPGKGRNRRSKLQMHRVLGKSAESNRQTSPKAPAPPLLALEEVMLQENLKGEWIKGEWMS